MAVITSEPKVIGRWAQLRLMDGPRLKLEISEECMVFLTRDEVRQFVKVCHRWLNPSPIQYANVRFRVTCVWIDSNRRRHFSQWPNDRRSASGYTWTSDLKRAREIVEFMIQHDANNPVKGRSSDGDEYATEVRVFVSYRSRGKWSRAATELTAPAFLERSFE
jgi:hypothetical protein